MAVQTSDQVLIKTIDQIFEPVRLPAEEADRMTARQVSETAEGAPLLFISAEDDEERIDLLFMSDRDYAALTSILADVVRKYLQKVDNNLEDQTADSLAELIRILGYSTLLGELDPSDIANEFGNSPSGESAEDAEPSPDGGNDPQYDDPHTGQGSDVEDS